MRVAIVGCGFVAALYMRTLPVHPELELVGVLDRDSARAKAFSTYYRVPAYRTLEELLDDDRVELVINLTNPTSHFEVSSACLRAGKHVYSEKPLGVTYEEAEALVRLAEDKGLYLSGAPSRLLGDTAQTLWKALRGGVIGKVRLAYCEMDDGLLHKMNYRRWKSPTGAPWPAKDEFETGCTVEHAGYALTWLAAFFGPAESVTAYSNVLVPDKETDEPLEVDAADFSVGLVHFASGVTARITNSIVATADHSIRIFGDAGVLSTEDCWAPRSPVLLRRRVSLAGRSTMLPFEQRLEFRYDPEIFRRTPKGLKKVDYCLGPVDLVRAVQARRPCYLSPRFVLHVNELTLAIHHARAQGVHMKLRSTFPPVQPMDWAR
ncbi:MAG: Gfo/Idh/MocA family oxidoreductase [Polyangiaceae bacterium]|jgi:predicted dehydrogenase|nr:Gfo/Idh/MocA family oxidoreductase [Polyangiaceae bacterium]